MMLSVRIVSGKARDYAVLARHHYVAGAPARPVRILAARHGASTVGVLVVSMPTLNSVVRELAWPGRYRSGDKRADAVRVNRELRVITRVIVEPCWRGLGVARRLVEAYLAEALTPGTEAIAAMGRLCPFFERAGMTAYPLPVGGRDARLMDALAHVGAEAWSLVDVDEAARLAREPLIARELRVWANGSRSTRSLMNGDVVSMALAAGMRVVARPVGYARRGDHGDGETGAG